jgi:hypothetical protein
MTSALTSFIAAFLFSGATVFAAAPVAEVRLALDENVILPGTPTGLTVIITNHGEGTLEVPSALWLTATNDAGQTFILPAAMTTDGTATPVPGGLRTLAPGASRELRFDPSPVVVGSPWFGDGRVSGPGRYQLRAVLAEDVKRDGTFDAETAMSSKEETLTVTASSDEDVAVWTWMHSVAPSWTERTWDKHSREFADYVMRNHPRSQYALFAAAFLPMRDHGEPSPVLEEQTRLYPNKAFTDQLKLLIIQYHIQALHTARHRSDMFKASSESDAARALATELMRDSRSSTVRASAKGYFDNSPTRESLLKKPETR